MITEQDLDQAVISLQNVGGAYVWVAAVVEADNREKSI